MIAHVEIRLMRMCQAVLTAIVCVGLLAAAFAVLLRLLAHEAHVAPPAWTHVERWLGNASAWANTHPDLTAWWLIKGFAVLLVLSLLTEAYRAIRPARKADR